MAKVSNSPDHEYDPQGLSNEALKARLKQAPDGAKIVVETADKDGDVMLGLVVEVQYGHDGSIYLRVNKTLQDLITDNV